MTDNEIKKALGICSSEHLGCEDGCPYVEVPCLGGDALLKDAFALVKTKDTELDILIRKNETLKDENFELKAEIERLEKEVDRLSQVVMYTDSVAEWKVYEAIEEFAVRLKKEVAHFPAWGAVAEKKIGGVAKTDSW